MNCVFIRLNRRLQSIYLDCGNDPDVNFIRDVKVLSQKRDSALYLIRLTIKNSKTKSIKYEYKEIISSAKFTITP
ncbi:unnamed protein product, partial [Rotaria sordida]